MMKARSFAAALAILPLSAMAAERPAATEKVSYGDLDLSTVAGREDLDMRIRQRAEIACRRELRGAAWTPLELHICLDRTTADSRASAERAIELAGRAARAQSAAAGR